MYGGIGFELLSGVVYFKWAGKKFCDSFDGVGIVGVGPFEDNGFAPVGSISSRLSVDFDLKKNTLFYYLVQFE